MLVPICLSVDVALGIWTSIGGCTDHGAGFPAGKGPVITGSAWSPFRTAAIRMRHRQRMVGRSVVKTKERTGDESDDRRSSCNIILWIGPVLTMLAKAP